MKDCPDGKLKRSDFTNIYSQFFPDGNAEKFASLVFNLFDEDGNGSIEFTEFLMALSVTSRGDLEDKLECEIFGFFSQFLNRCSGAFRLYDIDGNGSVNRDEMTQIIRAIFALTGQKEDAETTAEKRAAEIFDSMDTVKVIPKNGCVKTVKLRTEMANCRKKNFSLLQEMTNRFWQR